MSKEYRSYPLDTDFEIFWKAYPRKESKNDARKAWEQTRPARPSLEALLKTLGQARLTAQWSDRDYTPYPASWLRAHGFENEYETTQPVKTCAYCKAQSIGRWSGKEYCAAHYEDAQQGKLVAVK